MKTGTRNKDHLHNIGLLQAVPRFLVLPPGMLANANNPGNAKYICCSFLSTLDFLLLFLLFIKIQMKLFQPQCSKLFLVFAESQRRKKLGTFRPLQPLYRSPAQSLSSNWIGPTYKNVVNPSKRKSICWVAALDQCLKQVANVVRTRWLLILTLSTQYG